MTEPFTSFVILAGMRTGSNFLEANLNALDGAQSHGEVFNPHFIGAKNRTELFGMDLAARAADPAAMLARLRAHTRGLAGFRLFHDHDPRVFDAVMADVTCAKIVLNRNPVDSYVSLKLAQKTGQWKLTEAKHLKEATARFDTAEFAAHLAEAQEFRLRIQLGLQTTGQSGFFIDYEDLQNVDVLNGLAQWLGLSARLAVVDQTLKKQNAADLGALVENPAEMQAAAARLDLFNLSRSASHEPRRSAMVQEYVAAVGAGLLFLPVKGGPEAAVASWLSAIGKAGISTGFSQKTLKDWRLSHPERRAFTVLRHPVARAWAAYDGLVRGTLSADLKQPLERTFKLRLPQGTDDAGAMHEGFLAFLQFVKQSLAGQTGLRVPRHWASQSAILQGFAQLQSPDAVLREAGLAEGLARLAAEIGASAPPFKPDAAPAGLAAVYDARIEKAARDAWPRDYLLFGFAPWDQAA
jgi:LPS sulfotransferase NodH